MKRYAIKEIFRTLQGEGFHAGRLAVFVRFTGCNVWSGREQDRQLASEKGVCALWCDTDFRGTNGEQGGKYTADELVEVIKATWSSPGHPFVVVTGGEPTLQWDEELCAAFQDANFFTAMETNGSANLEHCRPDWVTLSPKPPMPVVVHQFIVVDEVKVVYPVQGLDPEECFRYSSRHYLQPVDAGDVALNASFVGDCIAYIEHHPKWQLSLQTHKIIGVP